MSEEVVVDHEQARREELARQVTELIEQGVRQHGEGKTAEAAESFTRALAVAPNQPIALTNLGAALRGHLAHDDLRRYNAVQKLAYLFVIADTVLIVLSGLVVWKSVQFPLLRELIGGFDNARVVHFFAMAGLVAFFAVHVVMVALVPRTLRAMIRGR